MTKLMYNNASLDKLNYQTKKININKTTILIQLESCTII